jgi:prepilin-type N-terminal cleavage/methylation domain-containing protein
MHPPRRNRRGFTLIEIVVAIVILGVGLVALASGAAAAVRSMRDSAALLGAARGAEGERERSYASTCAAASGVDSIEGATIAWAAAPAGALITVRQLVALPRGTSPQATTIDAAGPCR